MIWLTPTLPEVNPRLSSWELQTRLHWAWRDDLSYLTRRAYERRIEEIETRGGDCDECMSPLEACDCDDREEGGPSCEG